MDRTVLTETSSRRSRLMLALVTLVMMVAVAVFAWTLVQNGRSRALTRDVAADTAAVDVQGIVASEVGAGLRAADAFSAELDGLRRQAAIVAGRDAATAYAVSLEALARTGRQAYVDSRLPNTANDYVVYLDKLRRQGQVVPYAGSAPADADAFSEWLDELRRKSQ